MKVQNSVDNIEIGIAVADDDIMRDAQEARILANPTESAVLEKNSFPRSAISTIVLLSGLSLGFFLISISLHWNFSDPVQPATKRHDAEVAEISQMLDKQKAFGKATNKKLEDPMKKARNITMDTIRIVLPAIDPHKWFDHSCNGVVCKWKGTFGGHIVQHLVTALDLPAPKNHIRVSMEGAVRFPHISKRGANIAAIANYDFGVSDIFATYFQLPSEVGTRIAEAPPVDFATAEKKILWVASNCRSWGNDRVGFVRKLESEKLLDSVGSCLHNKDVTKVPGTRGGINKSELMTRYLFYGAFENQNAAGYVTEKFWDALSVGTVPVVYGVPNHRDIIPHSWAIWANDFASPQALAVYVRRVAHNKSLYMQFQDARLGPWPAWFVKRWTFLNSMECRICQWVAAKRYPRKYSFDVPTQAFSVRER